MTRLSCRPTGLAMMIGSRTSDRLQHTSKNLLLMALLFFFSGAAALAYQVLWIRELGFIVGSTAQAAALSISIFFAGIALGGWFWGRRCGQLARPLATFGLLEVTVAVTALGYLLLSDVIALIPASLHPLSGAPQWQDTLIKAAVATAVLLPPSFFMGGTLPVMAEHVLRAGGRLSQRASLLYGMNTIGGAAGALTASFVLPIHIGFFSTYLVAVFVDATVGITALLLGFVAAAHARPQPLIRMPKQRLATTRLSWLIAAVSGTVTLTVEVLWTRLFSQVLQNSVQTYALVLATFLLALGVGALVATQLARLQRPSPHTMLIVLLLAGSVVIALSSSLFAFSTNGMQTIARNTAWDQYLTSVAAATFTVIFLPGVVLGSLFPFLMRLLERENDSPGELIGRLVAVNTVGAIGGAVLAGFVLLPWLGASRALFLAAAVYPVLAGVILLQRANRPTAVGAGFLVLVGAQTLLVMAVFLPAGQLGPEQGVGRSEQLVEAVDGPSATVTVVRDGSDLSLRVNRTYTLGGTRSLFPEQDQTVLPFLIHPDPKSVFYLGMGTGITAGTALHFPVEQVDVCELIPEVVSLAEAHFSRWTNGLFDDPRARIVADDGRSCLTRNRQRYDLIISDLFVPWQAGTGSLYTKELYRAGKERLQPGGLFVQWIPLYQTGREELDIIARTMTEVFDHVTVLRGDLFPERSIIAFVASTDSAFAFDPDVIARNGALFDAFGQYTAEEYVALFAAMYAGNVTFSGVMDDAEINTDRFGQVELRAPRTQRDVAAGIRPFVVGAERERLYRELRDAVPVESDPALRLFDQAGRDAVVAGDLLSESAWLRRIGRTDAANERHFAARELRPDAVWRALSPSRTLLADTPAS